ncbi:DICT sensory domain-containing protein [Halostella litorea]|uniref:DICT sensory domain-containing protein n=1 Tax=Halostella litorea TaxID=2528831 RepID=UPI001092DAB4|nr:DICT sensory domain-containing protein [Halostella litorea]
MTLSEIVHDTGTSDKTLRICNFTGERADLNEVASYFSSQEVDLTIDRTESGLPRDVVVLESDGRFLAADPLRDLRQYVEGWQGGETPNVRTAPPSVVESMTETRFESYDKRRMIHASRIVEFRGWNVGEGELHAGFQDLSKIDFQRNVYRNLGRKGLDVHVYGAGDGDTVASAKDLGLRVHASDADEIVDHWWVAYDGDGDDADKSLLLAQERGPNEFYGFWSDDPAVVDDTIARLETLQTSAATV